MQQKWFLNNKYVLLIPYNSNLKIDRKNLKFTKLPSAFQDHFDQTVSQKSW